MCLGLKVIEFFDDNVCLWNELFFSDMSSICVIDLVIMWFLEFMNIFF